MTIRLTFIAMAVGLVAVARAGHPAPEPPGFWTGPVNDAVPATIKGGTVIHTRALAILIKDQNHPAVIIDVSTPPPPRETLPATSTWLPVPHHAIPGAIWIP